MNFSEEWLSPRIVNESNDAILFSDVEGIIRLWNKGAETMFGFSAADAIGQSLDIIIPEKLRGRHWEGYHRVMASGITKYGTELLSAPGQRKDGSRLSLEFSMVIVRGEDGTVLGTASIMRNVTAQFEREKALKERLAALGKEAGS